MVVPALMLGLVESAAAIQRDPALRRHLDWSAQRLLHRAACEHGLAARVSGLPVDAFVRGVLEHCAAGLRARGHGEEAYLAPLFARCDAAENPGQVARRVFTSGGMRALVDHLTIRTRA